MLKATDIKKLKGVGWKHYHPTNSDDFEKMVYRFSAYKYNNTPTLIGQITVNMESKSVNLDCFKASDNTIYAPFYYYKFGNYTQIINWIKSAFHQEFERWGIVDEIKKDNKYIIIKKVRNKKNEN